MDNVLIVAADETIRRLLEVQLGLLGRIVAWSGAAPPSGTDTACDLAIIDPAAPGALDFARGAGVPFVLVSAAGPTLQTRSLGARAHLTSY
jgi:hypothetical protein